MQPQAKTNSQICSSLFVFAAALLVLVSFVACSSSGDDGSPTSPANPDLMMTSADILVSGQSVAGGTFSQGHGEGSSTRFEAELMSNGQPAPGQMVWLEFDRPMMGGNGMMRHTDRVQMYDDGTHGDRVAGDGIYCLEDFQGDYGCHRADAEPGEYHYEFYGVHATDGHETNHMQVQVTITDQ
jgi:hypothetical protein